MEKLERSTKDRVDDCYLLLIRVDNVPEENRVGRVGGLRRPAGWNRWPRLCCDAVPRRARPLGRRAGRGGSFRARSGSV